LRLEYRGSRDGFKAADFHTKCDGKAKTITFVKTSDGNTIGGYTSIGWGGGNIYKTDDSAFMFSVDHSQKYVKIKNGYSAIWWSSNHGPCFLGGFYIYDNCDQVKNNWYRIDGDNYEKAHGDAAHLAVRTGFTVKEIEVFSLI
jgi:hypothetical protein